MKINRYGYSVNIPESVKIREEVFEAIIDWMVKNSAYSGESIMQSDSCLITASELLADIVDDIIKPEIKEENENI